MVSRLIWLADWLVSRLAGKKKYFKVWERYTFNLKSSVSLTSRLIIIAITNFWNYKVKQINSSTTPKHIHLLLPACVSEAPA